MRLLTTGEALALLALALGLAGRLLFGQIGKGGGPKGSPTAEYYDPIASAWLSPALVDIGTILSVLLILGGAGYYLVFLPW
jgi:hypothetical protein